jgi:hypothetical protein
MAKFFGKIGYGYSAERQNGVWKDTIVEKQYYGDVVKNSRRLVTGGEVNSDLALDNSISIIADTYGLDNIFAIRYVEWAGALWTVSNVEVQSPRLILRLGGVYHGPRPTAGTSSSS